MAALSHNRGDKTTASSNPNRSNDFPLAGEVTRTEASTSPDNEDEELSLAVKKAKKRRPLSKNMRIKEEFKAKRTRSMSPMYRVSQVHTAYLNFFFFWWRLGLNALKIGSVAITPDYHPDTLINNPPSPSDVTLELLLASQAHLGHATSLWNPANSRYIFGIRQGIHVISLDVIASHLRRACRIVSGVTEHGGLVLFVGTRRGQDTCVVNAAKLAGGCHLFERWVPGSITNGPQLLGRCRMKIVDEFDRPIEGFKHMLIDRPPLKPDLVICLNPRENWVMLHECALNNIPTMGIIDTDANPTWVTYPIPANDDSLRCVQVIAGVLGRAGEEGKKLRREKAEQGIVPYNPIQLMTLEEIEEQRIKKKKKDEEMDEDDPDY